MKPYEQDERFRDDPRYQRGDRNDRGAGSPSSRGSDRRPDGDSRPARGRVSRDDESPVVQTFRRTGSAPPPRPPKPAKGPSVFAPAGRTPGSKGVAGRTDEPGQRQRAENKGGKPAARPWRPATQPQRPVVPEPLDARALLDDGEAFAAGPGLSGEAKKAVARARTVIPRQVGPDDHDDDAAAGPERNGDRTVDQSGEATFSEDTPTAEVGRLSGTAERVWSDAQLNDGQHDDGQDDDGQASSFGDPELGDFDDEDDDLALAYIFDDGDDYDDDDPAMSYIIDDDDDEDPDDPEVRERDAGVRSELTTAVGATRATRLAARLSDATRAFKREQFEDAARTLRKLADEAPTAMAVRELYGLTLYRQGKWRQAAKELEAFRAGSGSADQNPVLADCYRALKRWQEVEELWIELKEASPSVELVIEGRIVAAAAKADRGELRDAMNLLQQGWKLPKRPEISHLRRGYALADLYERAGELAKARELFGWVATQMPDFADAKRRARQLR